MNHISSDCLYKSSIIFLCFTNKEVSQCFGVERDIVPYTFTTDVVFHKLALTSIINLNKFTKQQQKATCNKLGTGVTV